MAAALAAATLDAAELGAVGLVNPVREPVTPLAVAVDTLAADFDGRELPMVDEVGLLLVTPPSLLPSSGLVAGTFLMAAGGLGFAAAAADAVVVAAAAGFAAAVLAAAELTGGLLVLAPPAAASAVVFSPPPLAVSVLAPPSPPSFALLAVATVRADAGRLLPLAVAGRPLAGLAGLAAAVAAGLLLLSATETVLLRRLTGAVLFVVVDVAAALTATFPSSE